MIMDWVINLLFGAAGGLLVVWCNLPKKRTLDQEVAYHLDGLRSSFIKISILSDKEIMKYGEDFERNCYEIIYKIDRMIK